MKRRKIELDGSDWNANEARRQNHAGRKLGLGERDTIEPRNASVGPPCLGRSILHFRQRPAGSRSNRPLMAQDRKDTLQGERD